ncbi:MAG: PEP-CTERM sorting domain-containing protein [Sedimentisphaerales bacterium]|nr:PEP-CTERM sorting domain-containing protein [Sedimentisphaerales bacterium]
MIKRLLIFWVLTMCLSVPAMATTTVEFSPDSSTGGSWYYDGAGTLSFNQEICVDRGMGSNYDALVGSLVYIPAFKVSPDMYGTYKLTPYGTTTISIKSADGGTTYMTGNLLSGDLVPVGTIGAAYTQFQADITNLVVTSAGQSLGSAALDAIVKSGTIALDFELSLQGGSGTNYRTLTEMLAGGYSGGNGFSGAMSIPEPMTITLLGLGSLALLRKRRA